MVHYSATQIKRILTGSGRAPKSQVQRAIQRELALAVAPEPPDVADALAIPIANGEQDQGFVNFRWLIANDGIDIVQPDNYYFGGLIRAVKVGRMAAAFGKSIVPHMSGGGLGFLYNCHLVSVLPNAGAHHEFKGLGTQVPFECKTSPLKVTGGKIKVPTGPGLGVDIDPDFIKKHQPVAA